MSLGSRLSSTPIAARRWAWFFFAGAAFNAVIGASGLITGELVNDRIVGLLVLCFGIVYAMVGQNPARFAPMLLAGIVGKAGVVALLLPDVLAGRGQTGLGVILAGDALFMAGFILYLMRQR